MSIVPRIEELLKEEEEEICFLIENAKKSDPCGDQTSLLIMAHRFIGVASYFVHKDVDIFRNQLARSVECQIKLFNRFMNGDDIPRSYVAMTGSVKSLFDSLASGQIELSYLLAQMMGGRVDIEAVHDHPFDRVLGYALKSVVLKDNLMEERIEEFGRICHKKGNFGFSGYYFALKSIVDADVKGANKSLGEIVKSHIKQSKGRGIFAETVDEVLCVWGIGVANLMRSRGIIVEHHSDLIPKQLMG